MKKCKSCKSEIDAKAIKCAHCQTDQRNWFKRHPILAVILVLLGISLLNSGGKTSNKTEPTKTDIVSAEKFNVVVTSQIVKKVDNKYRYFFDIRNKDTKNFEGEVSITLFNELQDTALGGEEFTTKKAIEPELGTSQYIDINTGPTKVHGTNGISKFRYVVKKDNQIVNEGEGLISEKYEDLY